MDDSPLIRVTEAGPIVFPQLPPQRGGRRVLRWVHAGVFPQEVIVRAGRSILLRRSLLLAWLEGHLNGNGKEQS